MKTNEAPEKIWVHELSAQELDMPLKEYHIEYTRTDAFIEKACDYLQNNLWRIIYEESEFRQRFVTDFEKYMKGE